MEKVVVQTGAKTYQITDQDGNDLGVFRFIPSDAGILKRYKEAAAFLLESMTKSRTKTSRKFFQIWKRKPGRRLICCLVLLYQRASSRLPVRLQSWKAERLCRADYHCNWWNHRKRAGCKGKGAAEKDKKVY